VSLGILFGVILATFLWHSDNSNGQYDLGSVTSSATGLKGHLIIEWDKKAEYRLTLEPSDRDQQAGFALAVAYPPRPLAIGIQLKDNQGIVLCAKDIELKHDAQNQIRPDGQIEAIHAQGEIPCSKKACESISSWSFSTNFPSLAEQVQMLKRQEELQANVARSAPQAPAARKNIVPVTILPFSIEGDDLIDDFDASGGVIETRGRKTFFLDRASAEASDSRWQDYPVSIHYKCDQNTNCTLTHSGLHALRARLKR